MPDSPTFLRSTIEIVVGILLLFGGGELFVQGSVALALLLGISQLVIGLTVVSFGTSAPELFVSLLSVLRGSSDLAVSNVVGSNIFNMMVVLGASALVLPLRVQSRLVRRDVPVLLAVSMAVWAMASAGRLTWQAGVALLTALVMTTVWEIRTSREVSPDPSNGDSQAASDAETDGAAQDRSPRVVGPALLRLAIGLALLVGGSQLLVRGASSAAAALGVSEAVIGLTIVAAGTSMPELITSLVAALRGKTDLAIGNVVGSNLFNLLAILGGSATLSALSGRGDLIVQSAMIGRDLPVMVLTTLACLPIFWSGGRITRLEGGVLLVLYGLYLLEQVLPFTLPTALDEFRLLALAFVLPLLLVTLVATSLLLRFPRPSPR